MNHTMNNSKIFREPFEKSSNFQLESLELKFRFWKFRIGSSKWESFKLQSSSDHTEDRIRDLTKDHTEDHTQDLTKHRTK